MNVYWLICFYKEGLGGTFAFSSRQKAVEYRWSIKNKIEYNFIYADEVTIDEFNKIKIDDDIIIKRKEI